MSCSFSGSCIFPVRENARVCSHHAQVLQSCRQPESWDSSLKFGFSYSLDPPAVRRFYPTRKLTDDQEAEVVKARAAGERKEVVARNFGVSPSLVARITKRASRATRKTT